MEVAGADRRARLDALLESVRGEFSNHKWAELNDGPRTALANAGFDEAKDFQLAPMELLQSFGMSIALAQQLRNAFPVLRGDGGAGGPLPEGPPPPSTVYIEGSPSSTNTFTSIILHLPSADEEGRKTAFYNLRPFSTSVDIAPPVRAMFAGFGFVADAFYLGADETLLDEQWFETRLLLMMQPNIS
ncbi:hypothetical protein JKP88DRAFT_262973 [Tribonema minus]|uniref:Uncharacterized protein n=1 Tax=Tribonema minus TaxID=303371 RepID=A0A835YZS2_9STRA|nr:hypothetical protein JKP88DRAFT_262973 [Tribonema minus]